MSLIFYSTNISERCYGFVDRLMNRGVIVSDISLWHFVGASAFQVNCAEAVAAKQRQSVNFALHT